MHKTRESIDKQQEAMKENNFTPLWKDIEKNFDWVKVNKTMKLLDWYWAFGDNMGIPDVNTLKNKAKDLLYSSFLDSNTHATGGFFAYYDGDCLSLSFSLAEWTAEIEECV